MILLGVPSWIIRPFSNNKNNSTWNKCCHNLKIMLWNFSWQRKHQPYYKQHINELAITGSVNKVIVMCSAWYKVIKRDMQTTNLTMYVKEILWVTLHTTWLVKETYMYSAQDQKQKLTSHIKIESCYTGHLRKHNADISVNWNRLVSYLHGHKQCIRIAFRQILWGYSSDLVSIPILNLPFQFALKIWQSIKEEV